MNLSLVILTFNMEEISNILLLFYFKKGKNAEIDLWCQKGFAKFCVEDFLLKAVQGLSIPLESDSN